MRSVAVLGTDRHGRGFADVLAVWLKRLLIEFDEQTEPGEAEDDGSPQTLLATLRGVDAAVVVVFRKDIRSSDLHLKLGECFGCLGSNGFVAPVLVDMDPQAVAQTPLELFQCARCSELAHRRIVGRLAALRLPNVDLAITDAAFSRSWTEFAAALDQVRGPDVHPFEITLAVPEAAQAEGTRRRMARSPRCSAQDDE